MARANQRVSRYVRVRGKMKSIEVVIRKVGGVISTTRYAEGVNRGIFAAPTNARGRARKMRAKTEMEVRLRINSIVGGPAEGKWERP